ncbi:plectin [Rhagoletis pomonella]|uniref:plectin n=1 Tax=Rhagoletis pomonella TaxID=28610 RepID=UPI0017870036|nr:plectin [Rhagoletis pomonella]
MSVNITVNGKFKACSKPSILDDPVRFKKQLECELRKQRLLEVREESKNLARKIRNDVAAEKERQLRNLEAIKAKEFECWREHVLDQKNNDYRQAIFQIGAAHHAAKLENEAMAERKVKREQQRQQFRKKTIDRLGLKTPQTAKKVLQATGTQTPNVLMKDTRKKTPKKRKRKSCAKEHTSTCHCSSAESETESEENSEEEEENATNVGSRSPTTKSVIICACPNGFKCPCNSSFSSTSSTLSTTLTDEEEHTRPANKQPILSRNPTVLVDIEDCNDSVIITPGEIKDKHPQSNRQFSHVVRNNSPENPRRPSFKDSTAAMGSGTTSAAASKATKKRFTLVSQLINAKSTTGGSQSRSPPRAPRPPPSSTAATSATSTQKSPRKISTSGNVSREIANTLSGATVTLDSASKSDQRKNARDDSVGRVHSYDYNNKYTREYPHPTEGLVHQPSVRERSQPNAVQQAEIERELVMQKGLEKDRMRARSEERGRKALEREQVRRDCQELTNKLDALTQQYPQLLNQADSNLLQCHQLQANRAERLEHKRTAAVEELLLRPAIITCPEIGQQQTRVASPQRIASAIAVGASDLNLGAPSVFDQINNTGSTDSCGSIILGYVDEQQQKIRNDLNKYAGTQPKQNAQKAERLKCLLQRIEELRKALCEELNKKGSDESMQQVINDVSDVRRERERILTNGALDEEGRLSPIQKHMRDVQQKEAALEQKLRELCRMQKQRVNPAAKSEMKGEEGGIVKKSDGKECRVLATGSKPLEIIIKLRNDGGRHGRQKVKKSAKSPRKLSTLIHTPTRRLGAKRSTSSLREKSQHKQQVVSTAAKQGQVNRQNSYDSNSTSYRSLPSRITNEVGALVNHLELDQEVVEADEEEGIEDYTVTAEDYKVRPASAGAAKYTARPAASAQRIARVNPLIAHYVQRLLGMSRNSVRALGVSSSDIETPSSSIMNVSSNRTGTAVDMADSQERLQRVQRFIEDNRSFISDLEDTLRSQSDVTLETSIRIFEEVWQQRLRKDMQSKGEKSLKEQQARQPKEAPRGSEQRITSDDGARRFAQERADVKRKERDGRQEVLTKTKNSAPIMRNSTAVDNAAKSSSQQQRASVEARAQAVAIQAAPQKKHQQVREDANRMRLSAERAAADTSAQIRKPPRESQRMRDIAVSTEEHRAEEQIARYAQLTENCTHRIAELTKLIQKVRTEKKRLMEITLSSVSEGRNSTEYIELPDGTRRRSNASATDKNTSVSSSGSSSASRQNTLTMQPTTTVDYTPPGALEQQAATSSGEILSAQDSVAPLEKHKATGISRDSGISISRPVTAQDVEPPSQASATTTTQPSTHGATRKNRPPPTIQRYSPNFAEDDVAHELSTILEVDTPATSRINATAAGSATAAAEASRSKRLQPQHFPTFEQYAREMNLDVSQLDADTSMRVHQEFEMLIASLRAAQDGTAPDYREFPSLSAYLRNLSVHREGGEEDESPETIDDLIACLRVANLTIKAFPSRQEYMRQKKADSASGEFLDSASLENITDSRPNTNTETESESINIEEELRRRQILQHSFRTANAKEQIFSSTARDGAGQAPAHLRIFTTESGIEKLTSTSENGSSEFERQLFSLGMKWPATMRARTKKAEAAGGSNTSSSSERILHAGAVGAGAATTEQQRSSPKNTTNDVICKSPARLPDTTLRDTSPKRIQAVSISAAKEVQFEQHTKMRSPSQSPKRQQPRSSPMRDTGAPTTGNVPEQQQAKRSPAKDVPPNSSVVHDAVRLSQSRRAARSSSDCEFLSDFGRPLNLRDFLTKELLKHATSSSSSTPTDDSLRSAFLQSIIETMTPRTNAGSNQLDRQKTSTPVTHSAPSDPHSSGNRSGSSSGNTHSQLFSGESCLSSVRLFERSITRNYPRNASSAAAAAAAGEQERTVTNEQTNHKEK